MRKSFSESRLGYVDLTNRARVIMQSRDDPPAPRGCFRLAAFFHSPRGSVASGQSIRAENRSFITSSWIAWILNYYSLVIEVLSGIKVRFSFHRKSLPVTVFFLETYLYFYRQHAITYLLQINETKLGNLK